jgi:outer membrane receptor for ferrienterochelin and colicins
VVDANGPLPAVLVRVEDKSARADDSGSFIIDGPCRKATLTIELEGATAFHLPIDPIAGTNDLGDVSISASATSLEEMVVTGTLREVGRSQSPVPVEVITPAFLRRNPSPALFDAVGQLNGVRPQINCSICNTGDIHINGRAVYHGAHRWNAHRERSEHRVRPQRHTHQLG